jgi:diketogulonate reductase-like aldo/keto reductase
VKSIKDTYKLYNGVEMPCLGLGTYQSKDTVAAVAVKSAMEIGYRLIDTAAAYGNERGVGQGIRICGIPREEIFVTSKLRNAAHGYKATLEAFEMTLERLGLRYLDLYLIHWPNPIQYRSTWEETTIGTWKAFEELYIAGRIRAIGVSNFMPHHIEMLKEYCEIKPMVNQLRLCPGLTQKEVVDYCKTNEIQVEAYSPFGTGMIFKVPEMEMLAARYGKSVAQICLRWSLQMGWIPLPKSANPARMKENTEVFDFELEPVDVEFITNLRGVCGEAPIPDKIRF